MLHKLRHGRDAYASGHIDQPGGRWISTDEAGRVAFAPTRPDGQQLVINGQAVTFWQTDQIPALLDAFETAIVAGDLDPQLTGPAPAGHSLPLDRLASSTSA